MCHHLNREEWESLLRVERREDEEPRIVEVTAETEAEEAEPERDRERELIRA